MEKPKVKAQGTIVVEPNGDEFLLMLPDGSCVPAIDRTEAEKKAKAWCRKHGDKKAINVAQIEWRAK